MYNHDFRIYRSLNEIFLKTDKLIVHKNIKLHLNDFKIIISCGHQIRAIKRVTLPIKTSNGNFRATIYLYFFFYRMQCLKF